MHLRYLLFIFLLNPLIAGAQKNDSVSIFFALNDKQLSRQMVHRIDSLMYSDVIRPGENVTILGYADYLGTEAYNKTLSYARAINVQQYLISSGIKKENIIFCIGKGKVDRTPINGSAGYADDRKVQIITGLNTENKKNDKGLKLTAASDITKLKKDETLTLDNIYFLPGMHHVTEASMPALELLYKIMTGHPSLRIQIEGHICCVMGQENLRQLGNTNPFEDGYDADTQLYNLSVMRAKAIYDYLIKKGIAPARLKYKGFGGTRPLVTPELTDDDQNKNRRVEIRILDK